MAYDNTNRWTLNKNADKQEAAHADYKGKINVNGVEYWLNGWIKDGPNGKFISGTIKPLVAQSITERATAKIRKPDPISSGNRNGLPDDDMNDDTIPF
jgi:hypothetical protein